jgi:hypothetical protein
MSARVWTREELDRVHPLPEGWEWNTGKSVFRVWVEALNESGDCITIDENGDLMWRGLEYLPADLVLPVILASKGLDSFAELADAMDGVAAEHRRRSAASEDVHERTGELCVSIAYAHCARVTRAGRAS